MRRPEYCLPLLALAIVPPILLSTRIQFDPIVVDVDTPFYPVPLFSTAPHARFQFLQYFPRDIPSSDVAELRHCNLQHVDWDDYFAWASFILEKKMPRVRSKPAYAEFAEWQILEQEFCLELLEIYATHHGYCHFDNGDFVVTPHLSHAADIFSTIPAASTQNYARLAICIIAFQDAPQLQRLVEAVHMPHHYILIHLERRTSLEFQNEVQEIASRYKNVAVVQFGTIIYRTDSVSMIQLQLMKWFITNNFPYDYHVTLNGASFPLYSAKELALFLRQEQTTRRRNVWLGELTHKTAIRIRETQAHLLTGHKRLIHTRGNSTTKSNFRVPSSMIRHGGLNTTMIISPLLRKSMSWKTVSGNQAVYSRDVVKKLLASANVMKLFALAKYGCCGVLEEHTWIAAMHLIGVGKEALENGAVWQVWGGQESCGQGTVHNAILTRNATLCFKVDDGTMVRKDGELLYIHGNEMMEYLKDAKRRGFLFARKFQSNDEESMAFLDDIKREVHETYQYNP
jgi:thiol-disulfide isomerase/thioredoxin